MVHSERPRIKKKTLAEAKLFTNKIWFVQIKLYNGVNIKVVDTGSFLKGSLYQLSRTLNLKYKKRERPFFVEQGKKPKKTQKNGTNYIATGAR